MGYGLVWGLRFLLLMAKQYTRGAEYKVGTSKRDSMSKRMTDIFIINFYIFKNELPIIR